MDLSSITIQALNGISYGLLIFVLAVGLSLIFGLMRVINMAHGSFYMLGAYLGLCVIEYSHHFPLGILAAGIGGGVLAFVMERFLLRSLYGKELEQVLLTFGFAYIIMDLTRWLWGGMPRSLPKPILLEGSFTIMGDAFPLYRLAMIILGMAAVIGLWIMMEKTRVGISIRAGVDDSEMVGAMGINIRQYFSFLFTLGVGLAAMAGVIGGPILGAYQGLDFEVLVLALVVVVIGGLGTLQGTFWGSILIGLADNFGKVFFPNFAMITIYLVMALILVFKPAGLLAKGDS